MRTIHRYITFEVLRPLSIALLIALVVLLIERMLKLLDLVLGANGPLQVVFEIMAYLVPQYLGLALPISLMLGVMLAFNKLGRDGELDALHAAGVSLKQLVRPALIIALVVTLLSLLINGYLRPYGRYAYQIMLTAVTNTAFQAFVRAGVFTQIGNRTFLIEGVRSDGSQFERVFMFQSDNDGRDVAIAARDGSFARAEADGPPIIRLFNGVRMELRPPANPAGAGIPLDGLTVLRFGELRADLGTETALMLRDRGADERELTLTELWQRRNTPPPGVRGRDLVAEFNARIVRILTVPLLPLLAVSLAVGRRRSDRLVGIFIGLLVLVAFTQVIDFGKNLSENGVAGPLVSLWLPWAVFAAGIGWIFSRLSEGVPKDSVLWTGLAAIHPARLFGKRRDHGGPSE
jgi:lipopolysaccharide export system permease protein